MIISHQHRYLFIEVPHTGTTSIAKHLVLHHDGQRILHKHATYSEFYVQASKPERSYYVFATVRNPLDWVATEFQRFETDQMDFGNPGKHISQPGGWVTDGHLNKLRFVQKGHSFSEYLVKFYSNIYHDWFLLMSGRFNRVMMFERLAESLHSVFEEIGLKSTNELSELNTTSGKKKFEDLYDEESRNHAKRLFAPHMRRWGYDFPESWTDRRSGFRILNQARYSFKEFIYSTVGRFIAMRPGMNFKDIFRKRIQPKDVS